jgi:hypothetical protein
LGTATNRQLDAGIVAAGLFNRNRGDTWNPMHFAQGQIRFSLAPDLGVLFQNR